jgi:deazaflavin-dependent oxidoreductase (nitroreductase family)
LNGWNDWNIRNERAATIRGLSNGVQRRIFLAMEFKDGSSLVADLTTIGRKSGLPRTVELRLIISKGNFYASSSKVAGKHWCQNMIKNPAVEIKAKGERFSCLSKQVTDDALRHRILTLRDSPPRMERVVFEITPRG